MINKKIAVSQSNYIPWKGYFDFINSVDEFILYDDVQYTRRDWRNRNIIKTAAGTLWLTIPVKVKGKYYQAIKETEIDGSDWASKHWKTLLHHYRQAPCFEECKGFLQELYEQAASLKFLSEVNYLLLTNICRYLKIATPIRWSSEFHLVEGKTERLLSICKQLGGTEYVSGAAAKAYLDVALFENQGVCVTYFDYGGYPEYPQLYPPFTHQVSILDLLLNTGNKASQYMKMCGRQKKFSLTKELASCDK